MAFLFTDIEGSTRLWERSPDAMKKALERHDELLRQAIDAHQGYVFTTAGDAFAAAFPSVERGLRAAAAGQRAIEGEPWDDAARIRVRMALHMGQATERDGDYFGPGARRRYSMSLKRILSPLNAR